MKRTHLLLLPAVCGMLLRLAAGTPAAAATEGLALDITNTSLEELYNLDITTLSRTEQRYQSTAAALFVLTHEDLARTGVTSIPEALRLVPGVQVAKLDSSKWAVSIRGFSGRTSNKLLVMIDGRSIYNPLFAGVLWEIRDTFIEDIERIEVIRGPGGTLWGANAVNGVINIITKQASATQGTLLRFGVGDEEKHLGIARHGWSIGGGHVRVYGKSFERDEGFDPAGQAADDWNVARLGFRADWESGGDTFTLSGDAYDGDVGEFSAPGFEQDVGHSGRNLLFRWGRARAGRASRSMQVYYDRTNLDNVVLGEKRDTLDIEFQQTHAGGNGAKVNWGAAYRLTDDEITNSAFLALSPPSRRDALFSVFAQIVTPLGDESLELSVGTKLERNDYTGTELQPSVRLAWTPERHLTVWGAVTRAVRTPSRLEADLSFPFTGPSVPTSETLHAFEAGARWRSGDRVVFDATVFRNDYDQLATLEGLIVGYAMYGHTTGFEANTTWAVRDGWQIDAAITLLDVELSVEPGSAGLTDPETVERIDPDLQYSVRSVFDLGSRTTFDATLRHVDELPALGVSSYSALDLNFSWHAREHTRISLRGRNLLSSHHAEQRAFGSTEVERDVFLNFVFDF